jgi:hypothetical protein
LPFSAAVPTVAIEAGPSDVALLVSIWTAHPGLPDPQTCLGEDIYCNRETLVEPIQVQIPAGSTIILDGSSGRAELLCGDRQPAGQLVTTPAGTRFSMPTVRCNERLWIAFDADCYNLPELGHRITVTMSGEHGV